MRKTPQIMKAVITSMIVSLWAYSSSAVAASSTPIAPATMARIGTVDERFQSYNIEMIEVTGGRFWNPHSANGRPASAPTGAVPAGMDPSMYEYRPPIDLANPRLRALAA